MRVVGHKGLGVGGQGVVLVVGSGGRLRAWLHVCSGLVVCVVCVVRRVGAEVVLLLLVGCPLDVVVVGVLPLGRPVVVVLLVVEGVLDGVAVRSVGVVGVWKARVPAGVVDRWCGCAGKVWVVAGGIVVVVVYVVVVVTVRVVGLLVGVVVVERGFVASVVGCSPKRGPKMAACFEGRHRRSVVVGVLMVGVGCWRLVV